MRSTAARDGFGHLADGELLAPPLMWSEYRSTVHAACWRGDITGEDASTMFGRLATAPLAPRDHERLGEVAWQVADELGWAKTYDAEFVALARLLGCRLVTLDARLRRGTDRLGFVVTPAEL